MELQISHDVTQETFRISMGKQGGELADHGLIRSQ